MKDAKKVIETWSDSYKNLQTTYDERLVTPAKIVNNVQFQFVHEYIQKFLPGIKAPRVLEVGCGGAQTSLFLALRGFDVTCTDNSPEAIRLAKDNFASRNAKGTFVLDDLLNSSIPEASFDCVMSFGLLEHFDDINLPISAMTRLLKPGGLQIHCVIPKKISSRTLMQAVYFPARFLRNAWRTRSFRNIIRKSFRDFPHYENSYSERYYAEVFSKEGNPVLRCDAGSFLVPFFEWPFGAGNFIARHFSRPLVYLVRATDCSQSKFMHLLSQAFTIVCRKEVSKK